MTHLRSPGGGVLPVVVQPWAFPEVAWRAFGNVDYAHELLLTEGPAGHLDHASYAQFWGGKVGVDATAKLPAEGYHRVGGGVGYDRRRPRGGRPRDPALAGVRAVNDTGIPGMGIDSEAVHTDERAALQAFLDRQRELVAWKVGGCEAAVLQAPSSPSGMTALGIVQHLTDVEKAWWRDAVVGEPGLTVRWDVVPDSGFRVDAAATTEQVLAAYEAECRRCDAAIADLPLDRVGARQRCTVRWVYLHMIEETARHLGQLDLLRELADGAVGEDPAP